MKRKIEIIAFLVFCCLIIALAIRAGEDHRNCDKCAAALHTKK